jgi:hypothetical protein
MINDYEKAQTDGMNIPVDFGRIAIRRFPNFCKFIIDSFPEIFTWFNLVCLALQIVIQQRFKEMEVTYQQSNTSTERYGNSTGGTTY